MTIWFYVKTIDDPKTVGDAVCAYNTFEDKHPEGKYTWSMMKGAGEEEFWQIEGRWEAFPDLADIALIYRAGDAVVVGEVKDDLVPNFMDPLLQKYGIDNVRWIVAAPKK